MHFLDGLQSWRGLGTGFGFGDAIGLLLVGCGSAALGRMILRMRWERRGPYAAYRLSSIGSGVVGSS